MTASTKPAPLLLAPSLMSMREVRRWFRGPRYWTDLDEFAARLQEGTDTPLPLRVVEAADEIHGEGLLAGEEHMLFLVGTILVQNDQRLLWSVIYDAAYGHVQEDEVEYHDEDEMEFLERLTAKARAGTY